MVVDLLILFMQSNWPETQHKMLWNYIAATDQPHALETSAIKINNNLCVSYTLNTI
jgi:hypothetical protein